MTQPAENFQAAESNLRPRAAEALLQSEEHFRLLVEGVRDYALIVLDSEGRVASWNSGAELIKGYASEEILGRHFSCFYPPEDVALGIPQRELQFALARGKLETEGWRTRKDGTRFWANVLITALRDPQGRLRGFAKVTRDLTERIRAEESLRSVVNHVIDGIITIDERGTIDSFNPAAERIFGYMTAEVVGQNVRMLMPAPYHDEHDGYIRNYLASGQGKIIGTGREVVGRRRDGTTFPMDLAVSTFCLAERRFFTGIVRDITERKRLEQELRQRVQELAEAEIRMRSVVNHVVDGIISIDEQGLVATFNAAAEKIFGYTAAAVVGRNVRMLMPEPYYSRHDLFIDTYLKTGQAKIIGIGREVVGRRKNGSTFPMNLAISEFRLGTNRFFTGIVRDITERKRAEEDLAHSRERLELAQQAGRIGSFEWNIQTGAVNWSATEESLYGLARGGFGGRYENWRQALHPEDQARAEAEVQKAVSNKSELNIEFRILWPDRSIRWIAARASVFYDESGIPLRMVGVNVDITDRKEAEDRLRATLGQLHSLTEHLQSVREEERTRIAREIHDELGQALTALKIDVSWLHGRLLKQNEAERLRPLLEKTDTMSATIDATMRIVGRITSELRPGVLDDLGLIPALEWKTQDFEKNTGIGCLLETDLKEIDLDRERATAAFRIVQEALTNVARHAEATQVVVRVGREDARLLLEIEDNGKGIGPEETARKDSFGLMGMRERAVLAGGDFLVEKLAGKGTRITARLPLAP